MVTGSFDPIYFSIPTGRTLPTPSVFALEHNWQTRCSRYRCLPLCYFGQSHSQRNCAHLLHQISVEIWRGKLCLLLRSAQSICRGRELPPEKSSQATLRQSKQIACSNPTGSLMCILYSIITNQAAINALFGLKNISLSLLTARMAKPSQNGLVWRQKATFFT